MPIRAQDTRRKISSGACSNLGPDAGLALLKTCHKQNISSWNYLGNRFKVPGASEVPPSATLVSQLETTKLLADKIAGLPSCVPLTVVPSKLLILYGLLIIINHIKHFIRSLLRSTLRTYSIDYGMENLYN